jgi:cysteine desulfurase
MRASLAHGRSAEGRAAPTPSPIGRTLPAGSAQTHTWDRSTSARQARTPRSVEVQDVPAIASFLTAAQALEPLLKDLREKYEMLRIFFLRQIQKAWLPISVEGEHTNGLPHILGLRITGLEGQHVMLECNRKGIAISTGSACQVGSQSPSRTMLATGKTDDQAREFIRISFGKHTTIRDLELAVQALKEIIEEQMKRSG